MTTTGKVPAAATAGAEHPVPEAASDVGRALDRSRTRTSVPGARVPRWWKIRLFRGMVNDVRRRAPYYLSDWTDAWDYRVVPATVYMYFAK